VIVDTPLVEIRGEEPVEGGESYRVVWYVLFEEPTIAYTLDYTSDGGLAWVEIVQGLTSPCYYWQVPDIETDAGMLRVHVLDDGAEFLMLYSGRFSIVSTAGVIGGAGGHIDRLSISPNPSMSSFTLSLAPTGDGPISLRIYSVTGELVKTLVDGQIFPSSRSVTWDGTNAHGIPVAAGTYFAVLTEGDHKTAKKLILHR
jgi:hypothetical protein